MLFNSIHFAIFLPIVFLLYWFVFKSNLKSQNILLLVASYFFYACWDYRFLFLLIFSTLLDYFSGIKIAEVTKKAHKKFWFWLSICINLGFLGVFKYYNFFADSLKKSFSFLGVELELWTLQVILPVGISFYTFHGLSYVIDVYKDRIKSEKNFIDYSLFVSFFPLLVAGPIERATHLLPQIKKNRSFQLAEATDGLRQILWGLFKKVVIADGCAEFANLFLNNASDYHGLSLVAGAIFFTIQIYGDFSGYSDIALGTARLFGIDLLRNFSYPYFSRDIAEFWRRWHISLSSWFRDYLYIPLGGSKGGLWIKIRNTFIIFIVSGFWHGANWTFIAWGALNALFILPSIVLGSNRTNLDIVAKGKILPSIKEFSSIVLTFTLSTFAWIFFRAESISKAFSFIKNIFLTAFQRISLIEFKEIFFNQIHLVLPLLIIFFFVIEWLGRENKHPLANLELKMKPIFRYLFYYLIVLLIYIYSGKEQQFIYFQF